MDRIMLREKATAWIGKYKYLLLVLLVGVGLMLIPSNSDKQDDRQTSNTVASQPSLSDELTAILSKIQGAGKVQVLLTVKAGEQIIYQVDSNGTDRDDTVIVTDAERAQNGLIQQVIPATYRGAIILCQGADSPSVRLAVTDAVSSVTGLDSSRISVLKMK